MNIKIIKNNIGKIRANIIKGYLNNIVRGYKYIHEEKQNKIEI